MHTEIAKVDRKQKTRQVDQPILDEQLGTIERELQLLQERVKQIRRANTLDKPGGLQS